MVGSSQHGRQCQNGFTLIKLLMVIAIIAVLASLLLPALSKARSKANDIVSVNNLTQMMVGIRMHVDDIENMRIS